MVVSKEMETRRWWKLEYVGQRAQTCSYKMSKFWGLLYSMMTIVNKAILYT